ncbi:MAG: hypothetical protein ACRC7W_07075 [Fusobacteriaceae bacterium]
MEWYLCTENISGDLDVTIEKVDVERETKENVFVNGNRYNKISNRGCYFKTIEEAEEFRINSIEVRYCDLILEKEKVCKKEKIFEKLYEKYNIK